MLPVARRLRLGLSGQGRGHPQRGLWGDGHARVHTRQLARHGVARVCEVCGRRCMCSRLPAGAKTASAHTALTLRRHHLQLPPPPPRPPRPQHPAGIGSRPGRSTHSAKPTACRTNCTHWPAARPAAAPCSHHARNSRPQPARLRLQVRVDLGAQQRLASRQLNAVLALQPPPQLLLCGGDARGPRARGACWPSHACDRSSGLAAGGEGSRALGPPVVVDKSTSVSSWRRRATSASSLGGSGVTAGFVCSSAVCSSATAAPAPLAACAAGSSSTAAASAAAAVPACPASIAAASPDAALGADGCVADAERCNASLGTEPAGCSGPGSPGIGTSASGAGDAADGETGPADGLGPCWSAIAGVASGTGRTAEVLALHSPKSMPRRLGRGLPDLWFGHAGGSLAPRMWPSCNNQTPRRSPATTTALPRSLFEADNPGVVPLRSSGLPHPGRGTGHGHVSRSLTTIKNAHTSHRAT